MAVALTLTTDEIGRGALLLERAARRTSDLSPLMRAIGGALVGSVQERFERETGPDGRRWPASHRARTQGGQTLTDSGQLRASVTDRASRDRVEVGTNKVYAGAHQFGATIKGKGGRLKFSLPGVGFVSPLEVRLPARPFIGVGGDDRETIAELAQGFLDGAFA